MTTDNARYVVARSCFLLCLLIVIVCLFHRRCHRVEAVREFKNQMLTIIIMTNDAKHECAWSKVETYNSSL